MPQLMILKNNRSLNIDNEKLDISAFGDKILEESKELSEAIKIYKTTGKDKEHIAEEALDTIQVCIGILDKLEGLGINIRAEVLRHEQKLKKRKWTTKKMILFQIFNWDN